jgi:tetratricopeptide (TPR) repeat protein
MRKYLLHVLIISVLFLLAPTVHVATYAGEIEDAKEEVRKNPDDADAHGNLGGAYSKSGKYEEAIESLKQAIRIKPDFALAHYVLGIAYGNLGKYKKAIDG